MKHKHADLMAAYAADAQTTDKPWELWENQVLSAEYPGWMDCISSPAWAPSINYRRKQKQYTVRIQETAVYERTVSASDQHEAVKRALYDHIDGDPALRNSTCTAVIERDAEVV